MRPSCFSGRILARTTRRRQARAIDSFLELREGDLVVHVAHGIGRYRGLRLLEKEGRAEEHLELEYHGGTKIYVPSAKIELVQKYVGGKGAKVVARAHRRQGVGAAEGGGAEGGHRSGGRDDRAAGGARRAAGHRVSARHRVAARVRRGVSVPGNARPAHGDRRHQARHAGARGRWTGCCAATSASARRSWRFARRSRRSMPATRWRCWCRRRCWPSSIAARSRRGWRSFRFRSRRCRGSARRRSSARSSSGRPTGSSIS